MFEHLLAKPKVHSVVFRILRAFAENKIAVGDRLPPLRQLAEELDVSIYTIHSAISELKNSGYVEDSGKSTLNFVAKLPASEELIDLKGVVISLLVRDYNDMSKLGSMLIREQFNVAFKKEYPDIEVKEIQAKGPQENFTIEQIKHLMRSGSPTTNTITQTELPVYEKFKLIAPLREELLSDYLGQMKPEYVERCRVDGKLYLMPVSATVTCYTYNHKVFRDAGVDPEYCFSNLAAFMESLHKLRDYTGKPPLIFPCAADMYLWLQHLAVNDLGIKVPGQQFMPPDWQEEDSTGSLEYFFKVMFEEKLGTVNETIYEDNILSLYNNEIPIVFDSGTLAGYLMGHRQTANYSLAQLGGIGLANVSGSFIRAGADEREQLAVIKYIQFYMNWIHGETGVVCRAAYNRFLKPWTIYKNIEDDKFLFSGSNFPDSWMNEVRKMEKNLIWEPLGNDWEKFLCGNALQKLLDSERNISMDSLRFYLSSISSSSVSGEQLTQIMALA